MGVRNSWAAMETNSFLSRFRRSSSTFLRRNSASLSSSARVRSQTMASRLATRRFISWLAAARNSDFSASSRVRRTGCPRFPRAGARSRGEAVGQRDVVLPRRSELLFELTHAPLERREVFTGHGSGLALVAAAVPSCGPARQPSLPRCGGSPCRSAGIQSDPAPPYPSPMLYEQQWNTTQVATAANAAAQRQKN